MTVGEKARSEKLQKHRHCVGEPTDMAGADTSTVSWHLSLLKAAGIVEDRKEGTTVYYSLACECISEFTDGLETIIRRNVSRQRAALTTA